MEELFCARAPKTEDKKDAKKETKKKTLISLLDGKRANNVSIVLSQFKGFTYKQVCLSSKNTCNKFCSLQKSAFIFYVHCSHLFSNVLFSWQMVENLLNVDTSAYNAEQLEALLKYAPTPDEAQTIGGYTGDVALLDKPEQFFVELLTVKRLNEKLSCFILRLEFDGKIAGLDASVTTYGSAIKEIDTSPKMRRVLDIILHLGEYKK